MRRVFRAPFSVRPDGLRFHSARDRLMARLAQSRQPHQSASTIVKPQSSPTTSTTPSSINNANTLAAPPPSIERVMTSGNITTAPSTDRRFSEVINLEQNSEAALTTLAAAVVRLNRLTSSKASTLAGRKPSTCDDREVQRLVNHVVAKAVTAATTTSPTTSTLTRDMRRSATVFKLCGMIVARLQKWRDVEGAHENVPSVELSTECKVEIATILTCVTELMMPFLLDCEAVSGVFLRSTPKELFELHRLPYTIMLDIATGSIYCRRYFKALLPLIIDTASSASSLVGALERLESFAETSLLPHAIRVMEYYTALDGSVRIAHSDTLFERVLRCSGELVKAMQWSNFAAADFGKGGQRSPSKSVSEKVFVAYALVMLLQSASSPSSSTTKAEDRGTVLGPGERDVHFSVTAGDLWEVCSPTAHIPSEVPRAAHRTPHSILNLRTHFTALAVRTWKQHKRGLLERCGAGDQWIARDSAAMVGYLSPEAEGLQPTAMILPERTILLLSKTLRENILAHCLKQHGGVPHTCNQNEVSFLPLSSQCVQRLLQLALAVEWDCCTMTQVRYGLETLESPILPHPRRRAQNASDLDMVRTAAGEVLGELSALRRGVAGYVCWRVQELSRGRDGTPVCARRKTVHYHPQEQPSTVPVVLTFLENIAILFNPLVRRHFLWSGGDEVLVDAVRAQLMRVAVVQQLPGGEELCSAREEERRRRLSSQGVIKYRRETIGALPVTTAGELLYFAALVRSPQGRWIEDIPFTTADDGSHPNNNDPSPGELNMALTIEVTLMRSLILCLLQNSVSLLRDRARYVAMLRAEGACSPLPAAAASAPVMELLEAEEGDDEAAATMAEEGAMAATTAVGHGKRHALPPPSPHNDTTTMLCAHTFYYKNPCLLLTPLPAFLELLHSLQFYHGSLETLHGERGEAIFTPPPVENRARHKEFGGRPTIPATIDGVFAVFRSMLASRANALRKFLTPYVAPKESTAQPDSLRSAAAKGRLLSGLVDGCEMGITFGGPEMHKRSVAAAKKRIHQLNAAVSTMGINFNVDKDRRERIAAIAAAKKAEREKQQQQHLLEGPLASSSVVTLRIAGRQSLGFTCTTDCVIETVKRGSPFAVALEAQCGLFPSDINGKYTIVEVNRQQVTMVDDIVNGIKQSDGDVFVSLMMRSDDESSGVEVGSSSTTQTSHLEGNRAKKGNLRRVVNQRLGAAEAAQFDDCGPSTMPEPDGELRPGGMV